MEALAPSQRWMIVDIRLKDGVAADLAGDCWTRVTPEETITFVPRDRPAPAPGRAKPLR